MHTATFSYRFLILCSLLAATLICVHEFPPTPLDLLSFGSIALLSFGCMILLRTILKRKSSPLERLSTFFAFLSALGIASFGVFHLQTFLSQTLNMLSVSFAVALFAISYLLLKEAFLKTLHHFCPWLNPTSTHYSLTRMLIPDIACLEDGRICDLVRTGLLDQQLVIPHFLYEKVKDMMDDDDELVQERAKLALDAIRRLECSGVSILKHPELDANEELSVPEKLLKMAKMYRATIISNDSSFKSTIPEDIAGCYIIFLEAIASALKPTLPKGQQLSIKIQRLGKEPKQGIGYLDDRTMVVVNGGGDHLGRQVKFRFFHRNILPQEKSSSAIFLMLQHPVI